MRNTYYCCGEVPINIAVLETRWTKIHVLDGEEQALLLGREFLRSFGRVTFNWDDGSITLENAKVEIHEQATEETH